jgi:hypothetical protein
MNVLCWCRVSRHTHVLQPTFIDVLSGLFRAVALAVEQDESAIVSTFGAAALLDVVVGVQAECDSQGLRMLQRFVEARRIAQLVNVSEHSSSRCIGRGGLGVGCDSGPDTVCGGLPASAAQLTVWLLALLPTAGRRQQEAKRCSCSSSCSRKPRQRQVSGCTRPRRRAVFCKVQASKVPACLPIRAAHAG